MYTVGFIATYLLFLVVFTPANLLTRWIDYPKNIAVGNISGSIWNSHIDKLSINSVILEGINIDLSFLSLLTLTPSIDVDFGDTLQSGPKGFATLSGTLDTLRIDQLNLTVPAELVTNQLPLPIPIKAFNTIDLTVEQFVLGKPLCAQLKGRITWNDAAVSALDQKVPLGKLVSVLSCQRGKIELVLDPVNNLGLTFTANIGQNFKASGQGYLSVVETTPEAIQQLLPFLGEPDRQGRYVLGF